MADRRANESKGHAPAWITAIAALLALPGGYGLFRHGDPVQPYTRIVNLVLPDSGEGSTPQAPEPGSGGESVPMQRLSEEPGLRAALQGLRVERPNSRYLLGRLVLTGESDPVRPFALLERRVPRGWVAEGRRSGACWISQVRPLENLTASTLPVKGSEVLTISAGQTIAVGFRATCRQPVLVPEDFSVTATIYLLRGHDASDFTGVPVAFQGTIRSE
jgi:hypothetical protein